VLHTVSELPPPTRLEVWQQVESPVVERAVAAPTQRHDTLGVVAAAAGARHKVGRIDGARVAADNAAASVHLPLLLL